MDNQQINTEAQQQNLTIPETIIITEKPKRGRPPKTPDQKALENRNKEKIKSECGSSVNAENILITGDNLARIERLKNKLLKKYGKKENFESLTLKDLKLLSDLTAGSVKAYDILKPEKEAKTETGSETEAFEKVSRLISSMLTLTKSKNAELIKEK